MIVGAQNEFYIRADGSRLIDGISGTYHLPLGHCSEAEKTCIVRNVGAVHNCYKEDDGSIAKLNLVLNSALHTDRNWKIMTTGSEAVEKAVMCSVKNGPLIIMDGAFHGKSFFTAKAHYVTNWNWPFEVKVIPWMDMNALPEKFDAILFEPVQGWTSRAATDEQMEELRDECDKRGAKLIADEILCGMWRAGRSFYSRVANPDIVIMGKGFAGSLPISVIGFRQVITPLVGWTATHAGYSLANRVAADFIPVICRCGSNKVSEIAEFWIDQFRDARVTGALIYIPANYTNNAIKSLRELGFVCADHNPFIRLAPCYTMSDNSMWKLADAIRDVRNAR
jgi:acetylornithine/succinyldiaminopimelate/putrescine aminotransferase